MALNTQGRNDVALAKYMSLDQGDSVQIEYVWLGGNNGDIRCKTKTLKGPVNGLEDIPGWNYDGSSTNQAPGTDSEVHLRPVKIVRDPFRGGPNLVCLCETLRPSDMSPIPTNRRAAASQTFFNPAVAEERPWYGMEQEYTMFESDGTTPLGWPQFGYPGPQGPYYCSVGARRAYGRQIVEAHYRCCMYAGISISGINAEVMPGQWEYQVGPVEGIDAADQMWLARYFLERVAEDFNVVISFEPKPMKGDWNGAGMHTNYSTESMRNEGGMAKIQEAIERLGEKHDLHMQYYGTKNEERLTGAHETAPYDKFSYGVANRGASIRIPNTTNADGYGYFEDRRPAANCDPYDVTSLIAATTILN